MEFNVGDTVRIGGGQEMLVRAHVDWQGQEGTVVRTLGPPPNHIALMLTLAGVELSEKTRGYTVAVEDEEHVFLAEELSPSETHSEVAA